MLSNSKGLHRYDTFKKDAKDCQQCQQKEVKAKAA